MNLESAGSLRAPTADRPSPTAGSAPRLEVANASRDAGTPGRMGDPVNAVDPFTIDYHHDHVPAYVEAELDRLYQNVYASLPKLLIYGGIDRVSTYVVRQAGELIAIWLFRVRGDVAEVLNELIEVGKAEANRFSKWLFDKKPGIKVIRFRAIRPVLDRLDYPFQHVNQSEDIVVQLPPTTADYLPLLAKSTRKMIKGDHNKLMRAFPDFRYEVLALGEATDAQIRAILDLSRARMAVKHKTSAYHAVEVERVLRMCRKYGVIGIATANGRMCAGTISYRIGRHYFMKTSAHDSAFDAYRLGNMVSYLCVAQCIDAGGEEAHFLWGEYDFKYSLLGVKRNLDNLFIYRSRLQAACHPRLALGAAYGSIIRRCKLWLHAGARDHRPLQTRLLDLSRRLRIRMHP
ncbi:MAG: GNAT family N-acetyltransferase [Herminiimonas sp.]|nr:GNAT family N-acetyltransferase [Herminiimonas sp.]